MNSLAKTMIISLTSLIVAGMIAVGIIIYINNEQTTSGEERSIDELNQFSYTTPEVTTDLIDGRFVRIQFKLVTDGKKSLKEVEKREFQIQNILIKEMSTMTEEAFQTGLTDLEASLQTELNEIMTEGQITHVYTITK